MLLANGNSPTCGSDNCLSATLCCCPGPNSSPPATQTHSRGTIRCPLGPERDCNQRRRLFAPVALLHFRPTSMISMPMESLGRRPMVAPSWPPVGPAVVTSSTSPAAEAQQIGALLGASVTSEPVPLFISLQPASKSHPADCYYCTTATATASATTRQLQAFHLFSVFPISSFGLTASEKMTHIWEKVRCCSHLLLLATAGELFQNRKRRREDSVVVILLNWLCQALALSIPISISPSVWPSLGSVRAGSPLTCQ